MFSVWYSKEYNDIIHLDKVICANDSGSSQMTVWLSENRSVWVHGREMDEFKAAYKDYIELCEAISFGLVDDEPKIKRRRDG